MSAKFFYGLLAGTAVVAFIGTVTLYHPDDELTTPVEEQPIPDATVAPVETKILTKVYNTVSPKHKDDTAERLFKLITSITNMENIDDIERLNETLRNHKKLLPNLLKEITSYQKEDHRNTVPKTILNPKATIKYDEVWAGYTLPVLVANPAGGVGNVMGQYATVFGLYKIFNMSALMTTTLKFNLNRFFDDVSLAPVTLSKSKEERAEAGWVELHKDHPTAPSTYFGLQLGCAGFLGPLRFFTSGCPIEVQIFSAFKDDLQKEFKFNDYLVSKANDALYDFSRRAALDKADGPPTYVGIHVRLKDYVNHMHRRWGVPDVLERYKGYLKRAMMFYKNKYDNVVFVLASDDLSYIEEYAKGSKERNLFVTHGTPGEDMCILTRCNQSIVTLGTFGFWSAFLKESGNTVYPDIKDESAQTYHFTRTVIENSKLEGYIPLKF